MFRVTNWLDIQPGDFWSYLGEARISQAIATVADGWSHSGIVVERDERGVRWNVESLDIQRRRPLSLYKPDWDANRMRVYRSEVADKYKAPTLRNLLSIVGQKYDWFGTASLAVIVPLNKLLSKLGINRVIPSPVRTLTPKCSELVLSALKEIALAADADGAPHDLAWCFVVPDIEGFTPADLIINAELECRKVFRG